MVFGVAEAGRKLWQNCGSIVGATEKPDANKESAAGKDSDFIWTGKTKASEEKAERKAKKEELRRVWELGRLLQRKKMSWRGFGLGEASTKEKGGVGEDSAFSGLVGNLVEKPADSISCSSS